MDTEHFVKIETLTKCLEKLNIPPRNGVSQGLHLYVSMRETKLVYIKQIVRFIIIIRGKLSTPHCTVETFWGQHQIIISIITVFHSGTKQKGQPEHVNIYEKLL